MNNKMFTTKQISLTTLSAIAFLMLAAVFYSSASDAHSSKRVLEVAWEPEDVTITLSPGETTATEVTATISCKDKKLSVAVSPELEPYISVSPAKIPKCKKRWGKGGKDDDGDKGSRKKRQKNQTVTLSIVADIPPTVDVQTIDGSIWLKSRKRESVKLPVDINLWSNASISSIQFNYPSEFNEKIGDGYISVGVPTNEGLPSLFSVEEVNLPPEFPAQVTGDILLSIANIQLESEDFIATSYHSGGLEVTARTFAGNHFFYYDAATNKAVEFMTGDSMYFSSQEFRDILNSLRF